MTGTYLRNIDSDHNGMKLEIRDGHAVKFRCDGLCTTLNVIKFIK